MVDCCDSLAVSPFPSIEKNGPLVEKSDPLAGGRPGKCCASSALLADELQNPVHQ